MLDLPRWRVEVLVKRYVYIIVEAASEEDATAKANEWDIVGGEEEGDTIDFDVTRVSRVGG